MTLPYYASAEQIIKDRSEFSKKGISKGKSVVILTMESGVLFVAENPSKTLHKVSEIYDRIGFAAVGKYNEFEALRRFGIKQADKHGFEYNRQDVRGQSIANLYALYLGSVFTEQHKPYEVELCVAEISQPSEENKAQLYRISYDGTIMDESTFIVMGGARDKVHEYLVEHYKSQLNIGEAMRLAVKALGQSGGNAPQSSQGIFQERTLTASELEVAVLEYDRPRRAFTRIPCDRVVRYLADKE